MIPLLIIVGIHFIPLMLFGLAEVFCKHDDHRN